MSKQIEKLAKTIAAEILDQMSDDDTRAIRDKGSEPWREGIGLWPMWTDDPEIAALSDDEKEDLLDEILTEIEEQAKTKAA